MARKPRKLSEDDKQVWEAVASTTVPQHPKGRSKPVIKPFVAPLVMKPKLAKRLSLTAIGSRMFEPRTGFNLAPDPMDALRTQTSPMDKRTHDKMRKGKLRPEARLDLHGMRAEQAHGALMGFIQRCHGDGKRLVLVITGKGSTKPDEIGIMPTRNGVLRHALPQWLSSPSMRVLILQITPAHTSHGGGGAYYVYLKKNGRG